MLKVCCSRTKTQPSPESEAKGEEGLLFQRQQPGLGRGNAVQVAPRSLAGPLDKTMPCKPSRGLILEELCNETVKD